MSRQLRTVADMFVGSVIALMGDCKNFSLELRK